MPPFTDPLLDTFTNDAFVDSQDLITRANFTAQFDHYYWLHRLGWLIRKLDVDAVELNWLIHYNYQPGEDRDILNFRTLPVTAPVFPAPSPASYGKFLNLYDLFVLQNDHSTESLTVLDIVRKLDEDEDYTAANFGADMNLLHEEWRAADVIKLTSSLYLVYPADYVFVSSWQRLIKGSLTRKNSTARRN